MLFAQIASRKIGLYMIRYIAIALHNVLLILASVGYVARWLAFCVKLLEHKLMLKGAWSEIFGKWIFFKLADMTTFPTKKSSTVKKNCKYVSHLQAIWENNVYVIYCFINGGNHVY